MKNTVYRTKHFLVLLWAPLLLLTACDRRELTYYTESEISVTVDWSSAGLEADKDYGATLLIYPQDGSTPRTVLMGERGHTTVRLAPGRYDAVVFNRSFDDFGAVAFRGQEALETFEAYARKVETRAGTRVIISSPEKLATATVLNFEVTEDMLGNYAPAASRTTSCPVGKCQLTFTPLPLTSEVKVNLNVKGLSNVREAHCTLQGISLSKFMYSGCTGDEMGGQEFTVGNPTFTPGSLTEGMLTGTINTFGLEEGVPHEVELEVLLVDGKTVVTQTLTNVSIREDTDDNGSLVLYLEASSPDPLPDVKPEGGSDSGFDADVGGWDDEVNTEIPV